MEWCIGVTEVGHGESVDDMTCIVAIEHDGKVYMGGDSASVGGWDLSIITHPKVFRVDDFLIGYTSSFRMGQLLEYNLDVPKNCDGDDETKYMITKFIPAVRECLKMGGYAKVDNNQEEGGSFLVGYRGKVYLVADDFQMTHHAHKFDAVGCGESYAKGALAAMEINDPKKAILKALKIAGDFSAGVRGPYYVQSL